jgi:TRAP-type C4-dicarboxylate transport system permease small subunit
MSWDLVRIYWPNAALPFALALMPLMAFTDEWQSIAAHKSSVQVQTYEMASMPSLTDFEQSRTIP